MKRVRSFVLAVIGVFCVVSGSAFAQSNDLVDDWFNSATMSGPTTFEGDRRGYASLGSFKGRLQMSNASLFSAGLPRIEASCGGIDLFGGGISYLDPEFLVQKLENILQAAPAVAFNMALSHICKDCEHIITKLENMASFLNSIQLNDCQAANRIVKWVDPRDNVSMQQDIRTAASRVGLEFGLVKNVEGMNRDMTAADNTVPATIDPRVELESCPARIIDLFTSGSVVEQAANNVGLSDYVFLIRGFVGDVEVDWPAGQQLPEYDRISACPQNDASNLGDFVSGNVFMRDATNACVANSTTNIRTIVSDRMVSIAGKMATNTLYTADENDFLATVSYLRVYQTLQNSVVNATVGETIAGTTPLIATTYGYEVIDDLLQSIEYMIQVALIDAAELGTDPSATSTMPCNTTLLRPAIEDLRQFKERVVISRGQAKMEFARALDEHNQALAQIQTVYRQRQADRDGYARATTDE